MQFTRWCSKCSTYGNGSTKAGVQQSRYEFVAVQCCARWRHKSAWQRKARAVRWEMVARRRVGRQQRWKPNRVANGVAAD